MLRVFKYESIVGYLILLVICIGLSINILPDIDALYLTQESNNVIAENIQNVFVKYLGKYGVWGLFIFLLFLQARFANRLLNDINLSNQASLLTAFFFVILAAWFHPNIFLTPVFIGFLAIIIAVQRMYVSILREKFTDIFDIGFFTALATLIHPPFFLLTIYFLAFLLLNHPNLRKWLSFFLGLTIPFYFLGIYWLFTQTTFTEFFSVWIPQFSLASFQITSPQPLIKLAAMLGLGGAFSFLSQSSKLELETRRLLRWTIGFWFALIVLGFLFGSSMEESLFTWTFPISLLIGTTVLVNDYKTIADLLTIVLIAVVVLFQFF